MKEMPSVIVAMISFFEKDATPLKQPVVDWRMFKKHIEFLCSQGVGLLPMGTTGESPALSEMDHETSIKSTKKIADDIDSNVFVLAGTGSNSTWEAAEYTKIAKECGCDAALLVTPYYNKPASQQMRIEYFESIANEFPNMPIIPYLISGRTGSVFHPSDLALLVEHCPNVIAVKYAEPEIYNAKQIGRFLSNTKKFKILSGDDNRTLMMITDSEIQACGVVSVMANIVPVAIKKMCDLAIDEKKDKAAAIEKKLKPLFEVVGVSCTNANCVQKYPNPTAIKTIMSGLGIESCHCAPPLGKMHRFAVQLVRNAVLEVWKSYPEALKPLADFYDLDIEARLADDGVWRSLAYGE